MAPDETADHDGVQLPDGASDPAYRVALSYIDRSRRYYADKGFDRPYRWVTNDTAPFTAVTKPLSNSRLAVVTTAFPVEHHEGSRPPKTVRSTPADPPPTEMYTNDLFWHKEATHTDDVESFLPLRTLAGFVDDGRLGSLNHRFFSVPTTYSRRSTSSAGDAIVDWCRADDVDLVLLVPL